MPITNLSDIRKKIKIIETGAHADGIELCYEYEGNEHHIIRDVEFSCKLMEQADIIDRYSNVQGDFLLFYKKENNYALGLNELYFADYMEAEGLMEWEYIEIAARLEQLKQEDQWLQSERKRLDQITRQVAQNTSMSLFERIASITQPVPGITKQAS